MSTSNFYYKNRCVAISDEDFEAENFPRCSRKFFTNNKMLLQSVMMFNITINIGYYSGACIDYSINDNYENILTEFYGYYYTPTTKKEIINDICYYCKDTINVSKKGLQSELKGLTIAKDFQQIIDKLDNFILPKIECKVNQIIDGIKKEYGYIELTRVATASNGETIYKQIG